VAFGGAGPLCACSLADLIGVRRVMLPPLAGVLSALGMAAAADTAERSAPVHLPVPAFLDQAWALGARLSDQVLADLPGADVQFVAECRYAGQGYELDVPCAEHAFDRIGADFHAVHQRAHGHHDLASAVEVVELRAVARRPGSEGRIGWPRRDGGSGAARLRIHLAGGAHDAAGYNWDKLVAGQVLAGPAVIEGASATALLPPGWMGTVNNIGAIIAEVGDARPR